jgi:hypothetical protein
MPKRKRPIEPLERWELTQARTAFGRFIDCLQEIEGALNDSAATSASTSSKLRQLVPKYRVAENALVRHAQITIAEFAFIDGERVDYAHKGLLSAFYANPSDGVASRYCWALLREHASKGTSVIQIVLATIAEHEVFAQFQKADHISVLADNTALREGESCKLRKADRLFYTSALLQRRLLVSRCVYRKNMQVAIDLEQEVGKMLEMAEAARRDLQETRLQRLTTARSAR